jgi:uncharacterized protein YutE (UPF0331/DUF86 family)
MYYVNHEQIEQRLQFFNVIVDGCKQVTTEWEARHAEITLQMAQERVLILAIETITDVGSLLIDGFLLRDASSYEDIIEILQVEQVYDSPTASALLELVKLRRSLMQEYISWNRAILHPLTLQLPTLLPKLAEDVTAFIRKELV